MNVKELVNQHEAWLKSTPSLSLKQIDQLIFLRTLSELKSASKTAKRLGMSVRCAQQRVKKLREKGILDEQPDKSIDK